MMVLPAPDFFCTFTLNLPQKSDNHDTITPQHPAGAQVAPRTPCGRRGRRGASNRGTRRGTFEVVAIAADDVAAEALVAKEGVVRREAAPRLLGLQAWPRPVLAAGVAGLGLRDIVRRGVLERLALELRDAPPLQPLEQRARIAVGLTQHLDGHGEHVGRRAALRHEVAVIPRVAAAAAAEVERKVGNEVRGHARPCADVAKYFSEWT